MPERSGGRRIRDQLQDIGDWVSYQVRHPDCSSITRRWSPEIEWRTAMHETEVWHDQQRLMGSPHIGAVFPPPWLAKTVDLPGGWQLRYISDARDLQKEGAEMRHCVYSYLDVVRWGHCQVYSLRDPEGGRAVTVGIRPGRSHLGGRLFNIGQARGKLNRSPTRDERRVIDHLVEQLRCCPDWMW